MDTDRDERDLEQLAAEGYRFYAREAIEFAQASALAVAEALEVPRYGPTATNPLRGWATRPRE